MYRDTWGFFWLIWLKLFKVNGSVKSSGLTWRGRNKRVSRLVGIYTCNKPFLLFLANRTTYLSHTTGFTWTESFLRGGMGKQKPFLKIFKILILKRGGGGGSKVRELHLKLFISKTLILIWVFHMHPKLVNRLLQKLNFLYKYFKRKKNLVLSNIILTNRCLSKCRTTSFILPRIHIVFHAHCHVLCIWNKFIWNGTLLAIEIKEAFDNSKKKY